MTFVAAALVNGTSIATTLVAGDSKNNVLIGVSPADDSTLAGQIVQESTLPFSGKGVSGNIQIRVVKSKKTGSFHYYWRIFNVATSKGAINTLNVYGWPGTVAYEVAYRSDSDGVGRPLLVSRYHNAEDPDPKQKLINFYFDPKLAILPGQSSKWFFIKTDATASLKVNLAIYATPGFVANVTGLGPK